MLTHGLVPAVAGCSSSGSSEWPHAAATVCFEPISGRLLSSDLLLLRLCQCTCARVLSPRFRGVACCQALTGGGTQSTVRWPLPLPIAWPLSSELCHGYVTSLQTCLHLRALSPPSNGSATVPVSLGRGTHSDPLGVICFHCSSDHSTINIATVHKGTSSKHTMLFAITSF